MAGDHRSGANARPWLGLARTRPDERAPDDEAPHRLPPERPFAGDDFDSIEALWDLAARRSRRRRTMKWVGALVVGALVLQIAVPLLLDTGWW